MNTLGIDPGLHGGLAHLDGMGRIASLWRMPAKTVRGKRSIDWNELLHLLTDLHRQVGLAVVIEKQMPFAKMDDKGHSRVMGSTGTMLENYGRLKLRLEDAGLEYTEVYPAQWQAAFRQRGQKRKSRQGPPARDQLKDTAQANLTSNERTKVIANGLFPEAADRFCSTWNDGTRAATLIGLHRHQQLKQQQLEAKVSP